jgi:hypothetical protein
LRNKVTRCSNQRPSSVLGSSSAFASGKSSNRLSTSTLSSSSITKELCGNELDRVEVDRRLDDLPEAKADEEPSTEEGLWFEHLVTLFLN